ncbi:uncharacterized protein UBRO_20652-B [Ustilago bromivora]|uniref:Uncharacterized protein n=1 Tax=Ustilago bromivora TaxID=307758 RepID=A0A1K0G464_9BASI|nr:uncharacterized protein UBRO_20652-B [Ustilago bromivora]
MRLDLFGFRRAPIANTMNERRPEQTVLHCTSTASTQELRKVNLPNSLSSTPSAAVTCLLILAVLSVREAIFFRSSPVLMIFERKCSQALFRSTGRNEEDTTALSRHHKKTTADYNAMTQSTSARRREQASTQPSSLASFTQATLDPN